MPFEKDSPKSAPGMIEARSLSSLKMIPQSHRGDKNNKQIENWKETDENMIQEWYFESVIE